MSRKKIVDEIDLRIINILSSKSNITNRELAELIELTPGPTLTRVNNLVKRGIITKFSLQVNSEFLGFNYEAFILCKIADRSLLKFTEEVKNNELVISASHIARSNEQFKSTANKYLLKIIAQDENHFIKVTALIYSKFASDDLSFEILPIAETFKDCELPPANFKWL